MSKTTKKRPTRNAPSKPVALPVMREIASQAQATPAVAPSPEPSNVPGLIDPFDPPEPNAGKRDFSYDDFWSEFEQTMHPVLENLPFDHPTRRAYWAIKDPHIDLRANRRAVRQAVDMLYAMPADERKRVLNGWNVSPEKLRCNRAAVVKEANGETIKVGLLLTSGPRDPYNLQREILPFATAETEPITVIIAVGTRKMEAIDTLLDLARRLERQWEGLVGGPEEDDPAEEGGGEQ